MPDSELARIADELAIHALVARYADAVARRDAAAWAGTWTADAEWHILGRSTQGRDAIVALWRELMGGLAFVLQVPGPGVIELDGDRARARYYVTERGKTADGSGTLTLGVYHDRLRREPDGWRFARRRFDILYAGPPDQSGPTQPFPSGAEDAL